MHKKGQKKIKKTTQIMSLLIATDVISLQRRPWMDLAKEQK